MKNISYSISDAAKKLNIETHVLRYWEEELDLSIPRNDLGHRYYDENNLSMFFKIKKLKEQNYSLHEIKDILKKDNKHALTSSSGTKISVSAENDTKMNQFREIMSHIVTSAIESNNEMLASMICESTSDRVMKEMNYLFRTLDDDEETRFIQLEAAVSAAIGVKREVAAAGKEKRHIFKRKNR